MGSSFKGVDLFGSGPQRFALARQGHLVLTAFQAFGFSGPESYPFGLVELEVIVTGRLVGASEAALWARRDAIVAQLEDTILPTPGTLIDTRGRSWTGMVLHRFEEGDRVDRGRVWSIEYTALFRRFKDLARTVHGGGS